MRCHRCAWVLATIAANLGAARPATAQDLPDVFLGYSIEVSLDPDARTLTGRETIRWTNPSAMLTVERVPLHLYLNGFAHEATTWVRAASAIGRFDAEATLGRHPDPWGWSEPRSIRQGETELQWQPIAPDDGNPLDRSLIEVELAQPVAPGETLVLDVEFDARLPIPIARTGGFDDYFMVAQWFPKISVFETRGIRGARADGFNSHQFHGPTEFYADYADFDVDIGLPSEWNVVATGSKVGEVDRGDGRIWHEYTQRAVHDFAFATSTDLVELVSSHDPVGPGAPVQVHLFLPATIEDTAPRWRRALEGALDTLGARVGPYPYDTITLVLPPYRDAATGGMEYPTLITGMFGDPVLEVGPIRGARLAEYAITHEFSHQYFYGLVGTNEFEEAFLDEGFTEYWGTEALIATYPESLGHVLGRPVDAWDFERANAGSGAGAQPLIARPSYLLRGINLGGQFYMRPALTMKTLERVYGRDVLDAIFSAYYLRWRFRHPRFEDFLAVARDIAGNAVADFIEDAYSQAGIPDYRIDTFEVEPWRAPLGRIVTDERVIEADEAREELDALAERLAGNGDFIAVERFDSGNPDDAVWASSVRITVTPESGEADPGWEPSEDVEYFESEVRVAGPAWLELPVEIVFRFADGATYRDAWDGRSVSRGYRFIHSVPLSEVTIDPDALIALDTNRANNGRRRESDAGFAWDWALWSAGIAQLLGEALTQWL